MDRESVDGDRRWEGASDFNPTFFVFKYRFQTPLMRTDVDERVKQNEEEGGVVSITSIKEVARRTIIHQCQNLIKTTSARASTNNSGRNSGCLLI